MRAEIGLQVRDVAAAAFAGAQLSAHRNEKNLLDFLPLATIEGRTYTLYSEPSSTNGTLTLHVRIHSPSTRTAHVPHSPLPHWYLMYCPA